MWLFPLRQLDVQVWWESCDSAEVAPLQHVTPLSSVFCKQLGLLV